jgi:phosphoglycolate phosphatase
VRILSILFDLDGTLVDTFPGIDYSVRAAVAAVLPDATVPELRGLIGPPVREVFRRALPGLDEATIEEIVPHFRLSYDTEGWRRSAPYPGVPETLAALAERGIVCAVVTNKPTLPTGMILSELRLADFFAAIVSPDSVEPRLASKAEAVRHVVAALDLDTETTVLVGDARDDAAAARETDIAFVAAAYGFGQVQESEDVRPVAILTDFGQILHLPNEN